MKNSFFIVSLLALFFACASEEEQAAFQAIENHYGCEVSYTKGFSSSAGKKTVKRINLELKGGELLQNTEPASVAPYAATLLYLNMNDEDIKKYTHIGVGIFKDPESAAADYENTYEMETVERISRQAAYFDDVAEQLKQKDVLAAYNTLLPEVKNDGQIDQFKSYVESLYTNNGSITDFQITEVASKIDKRTKDRLFEYSGALQWDSDVASELIVMTYEDPTKEGAYYINVK